MAGKVSRTARFVLWLLMASAAVGQTFEINQNSNNSTQPLKSKKNRSAAQQQAPAQTEGGIGWGSGIETARQARAAQQALDKGDYRAAVSAASSAARSAPGNTQLWFLLGYSARLAGEYSVSVDAYKHGLQQQPSSIQGLSGLAQTYAKQGKLADAQALLKQVLGANPRSVTDLQLAGELALNTDPNTALDLLKRADALQASARTELLIARAYQRLNQPDASKAYLQRALNRAPKDPTVLRAVGAYYRDAGQYADAIATLQKAAAAKDPEALPELAYTYQLAGKKKEAAEAYAQAAQRTPRNDSLQLSAAQALANVHQFDEANGFLKQAETLDPENYRLHAIRGQIEADENHNDEAIHEYLFALSHMPEAVPEGPLYPVSLHLSLYELYQRTEQDSQAAQQLALARTAIASAASMIDDATRPEYLRMRSVIEGAGGDYAAAEADIKQAETLDPQSVNILLNYANLMWKMNRTQDASDLYKKALVLDPNSNSALTAMGYLARDMGDTAAAEKYFTQLAKTYPDDFVPFLALGDLYTATHRFDLAQQNYANAHKLAPDNPLVVAGGINSALEEHNNSTARNWIDIAAANPGINDNPPVMRERERYLTRTGDYAASAELGFKVIEKLPHDPEAPVYLAYDLLFLNRYDEAYKIVQQFEPILPRDKDLRLIGGYYFAHMGELQESVKSFSEALELDPNNPTGHVNRGYVYNDLRQASKAEVDFQAAIKERPDYGEAYLGLAFSYLQLRRARPALTEAGMAEKYMGESGPVHLAMAEAYRQEMKLHDAEAQYRAALRFVPNDVQTHLALADVLYRMHRYSDAITALKATIGLGPDDSLVYAELARNYAQLKDRDQAVLAVSQAEKRGDDSKVFMATGEALLAMGENKAAMERYSRALDAPHSDRVEVRLALARLFVVSGRRAEAQEQVGFALAEARIGEANAVTPENLIEAGQILMSLDDFVLARKYFERAQAEGADAESVDIGLANAYLDEGKTQSAAQLLKSLSNDPDANQDYDYLLAEANVYRQEQNETMALGMFARANQLVEGNDYSQFQELSLAGDQGRQINDKVSYLPGASFSPIFEDINIYQLDARIRGIVRPNLLPPPRFSYESLGETRFRMHFNGIPEITGLFEERNQRGTLSFPNQLVIQNRNTFDTILNGGITPVLHLGDNNIVFNPGLQFTIRRDTEAGYNMDQNLFRQYLYMYSSPFFNWVQISGSAIREAGPFTEQDLHSRDAAATIEFTVGRPWGRTALITGYEARDVLFRPSSGTYCGTSTITSTTGTTITTSSSGTIDCYAEYFTTDSYVGIQRKIKSSWKAAVFAEYLRSWRVQASLYAIAQAMRPAFRLDYMPITSHWAVHAEGMWSRGEGFHDYDNVSNEVTVSYTKTMQRPLHDGDGEVPVAYPIRFSVGIQQQTFYDFPGSVGHGNFLPVVRLNFF